MGEAIMGFAMGFFFAIMVALPFYPHTSDGHKYSEQIEKTYQCEKIDKGRYIEVDGKKKCVLSIDVAK
jgi:hypothetical protein